jgi:hypothetical protein
LRFIGRIYRLFFGRLDKRAYQKNRREFLAQIESSFSLLFNNHNGRIVSREGEGLPRAFDFVAATIEFPEIRFRFIQGRGELRTQVAPSNDPEDWLDLSILWCRIESRKWRTPPRADETLSEIAERLHDCWNEIIEALSAIGI